MSLRSRETLRLVFIWLAHTQDHGAHTHAYRQLRAAVQTLSSDLLLSQRLFELRFLVFLDSRDPV